MRFLGAGFLWISLTLSGVVYSLNLSRHLDKLRQTRLLLEEIMAQLEFLNTPLKTLLFSMEDSTSFSSLDFIRSCNKALRDGDDFPVAWVKGLIENRDAYSRQQLQQLIQLGEFLGKTAVEGQRNILKLYCRLFDEHIEKAKLKKDKYGTVSIGLAAAAASAVFILIV